MPGRSTQSLDGTVPRMTLSEIESLPLHDATLEAVEVRWAEGLCTVSLKLSSGKHLLKFGGVTMAAIPHRAPWGPSVCVNGASARDGVVSIEMQSGDTIEIAAEEVTFSAI